MNPAEVLARLDAAGIRLVLDAGALYVEAPANDVYTVDLRALVAEHRPALVAALATKVHTAADPSVEDVMALLHDLVVEKGCDFRVTREGGLRWSRGLSIHYEVILKDPAWQRAVVAVLTRPQRSLCPPLDSTGAPSTAGVGVARSPPRRLQ